MRQRHRTTRTDRSGLGQHRPAKSSQLTTLMPVWHVIRQSLRQRLSLKVLQDEEIDPVPMTDVIDCAGVRIIGSNLPFAARTERAGPRVSR